MEQNDNQDSSRRQEGLGTHGHNRRRLSRAMLGATPLLMTLHASPLKAAGANCMPSGWASGNVSRHDGPQDCGGHSPDYWSGGYDPTHASLSLNDSGQGRGGASCSTAPPSTAIRNGGWRWSPASCSIRTTASRA